MLFGYEYEVYLKLFSLLALTLLAYFLVEWINNRIRRAIDESPRWKFLHKSRYDELFKFLRGVKTFWKK